MMIPIQILMSCPSDNERGSSNSKENKIREKEMRRCRYVCKMLNKDRKESLTCDATILIEEEIFPVHKCVMCASSSYFSALITGRLNEKNKEPLEIVGVSAEIFAVVLRYIYGKDIKLTVTNVEDIYRAGGMLCIDTLIMYCKSFIMDKSRDQRLTEDAYQVAVRLEIHDIVASIAQETIGGMIFKDRECEIGEMSHNFLCSLLEGTDLISQLHIGFPTVINLIRWAFYKHEEILLELVFKLLSFVPFQLITKNTFSDILDFVFTKENISSGILSQLTDSLRIRYLLSHDKMTDQNIRLLSTSYCGKTLFLFNFRPETWDWEKYSSCNLYRPVSLTVNKEDLFILSGFGVVKFDLKTQSQVKLPNFPRIGLKSSVLSVVDGIFHVMFIGKGTNKCASGIYALRPSSPKWELVFAFSGKASYVCSATHGQNMYLVVGYTKEMTCEKLIQVWEFNILFRKCRKLTTLPGLHFEPFVVIHKDTLYLFSRTYVTDDNSCFAAFDLASQMLVTSDVNALQLSYPIQSVCSIPSGILIAYECVKGLFPRSNRILVTLYIPKGECPSVVLGLVPLPEKKGYDLYFDLFFYISK